jgi:hypothetical protein
MDAYVRDSLLPTRFKWMDDSRQSPGHWEPDTGAWHLLNQFDSHEKAAAKKKRGHRIVT